MSFPEWGHSYNALYLPLSRNLQCALVPSRELPQVDRGWRLSFEERKKKKKERQEQIEKDRQDFDRLFALDMNRRQAAGSAEVKECVEFIDRNLRASSWDLLDGAGVTRVLRDAVRDKTIIPVIARNWRGEQRVFRHYAPQCWAERRAGGHGNAEVLTWKEFDALKRTSGEWPGRNLSVATDAISNGSERGFDWLSVVGAVVKVEPSYAEDNCGKDSMLRSFQDSDGDGSAPGDSQPFEYGQDGVLGKTQDVAGILPTPAEESQCELQYNLDMAECSAYAAIDKRYWGVCKERAMGRYSNCLRGRIVE